MITRLTRRSLIIGAGLLTAAAGTRAWLHEELGVFSGLSDFNRTLIPEEPFQAPLDEPFRELRDGYTCTLFAWFSLRAVVLARRRYDDEAMGISPLDLALGWGVMSNPITVSKVRVRQGGRFYMWNYPAGSNLSEAQVVHSSANMHMIPDSPRVHAALMGVRRHDVIAIDGYLCDLQPPRGPQLFSSRNRQDTGAGACEIVWVDSLRQLGIRDLTNQARSSADQNSRTVSGSIGSMGA